MMRSIRERARNGLTPEEMVRATDKGRNMKRIKIDDGKMSRRSC